MSIGKNIIKYRERIGMTRIELAEKIGVSPSTITRYEKGDREPRLDQLRSIAAALNTTTGDLTFTEEKRNKMIESTTCKLMESLMVMSNNDESIDGIVKLLGFMENIGYKIESSNGIFTINESIFTREDLKEFLGEIHKYMDYLIYTRNNEQQ